MRNNILVIYPYFAPAQKAGGVVSSLVNLVIALKEYNFFVITTNTDLDGSVLEGVTPNIWCNFGTNCEVLYYNKNARIDYRAIAQEKSISTVYINGIYGYTFFVKPLLELNKWKYNEGNQIIISPRGMIQKGSLSIKPFKKKVYFGLLNLLLLFRNIKWHSTDKQEDIDIREFFNTNLVTLAKDSPSNTPSFLSKQNYRQDGIVRLIFLSLITEKKNLLFLLKLLNDNKPQNVQLDIHGPIKDSGYWQDCLKLINNNNHFISYKGEAPTSEVCAIINSYDYLVLPTLGENFGHVIFESLTAGTPVLISEFTPWKELETNGVGWNLVLDENVWLEKINNLSKISKDEYLKMSCNCHKHIIDFIDKYNPEKAYFQLFSNNKQ